MPWFDPGDAGVTTRVLLLYEAPRCSGPSAPSHPAHASGSGFISADNDVQTAAATYQLPAAAGLRLDLVLHWSSPGSMATSASSRG